MDSATHIVDSPVKLSFQSEEIQTRHYIKDSPGTIRPEAFIDHEVPVVILRKTQTTVTLVEKGKKSKNEKLMDVFARGVLKGNNNSETTLDGVLDFRGNFEGSFEKD